jgi:oxalate decarboxylase/phosphoglucose isomerase-like protein (cupin superfamily)
VFVTTQGEYIVIANDGDVRNFPVGSVLLLEDTWGAGHQTSNIGDIDVVALIVSVPDPETSGS